MIYRLLRYHHTRNVFLETVANVMCHLRMDVDYSLINGLINMSIILTPVKAVQLTHAFIW